MSRAQTPGRIRILPPELANKIAAGEVVGRPSSVVKELLENSIDAEASAISVVLTEGGKRSILVVDDGRGMEEEDARLAFDRHATSKIASLDDLENIRTLGFRGEALASIGAVAQVELKTRTAREDTATTVRIAGSGKTEVSRTAAPPGTSILVRNLFFNTPGRRNFLKSASTELKHCVDVVRRIALANPAIALRLTSDDETLLDAKGGSAEDRLREVFGENAVRSVLPFSAGQDPMTLSGFLGKPDFARSSRTEQYLYLNGRHITSRAIGAAVFQAYEHLLEKGSFPMYILFLSVDPRKVDVNVHPSKMEVRFEDESSVYRFILSSVRRALSEHDLVPAAGSVSVPGPGETFSMRLSHAQSGARVSDWRDLLGAAVDGRPGLPGTSSGTTGIGEPQVSYTEAAPGASAEGVRALSSGVPHAKIYQLHRKYIILPTAEGLMLIDQHAAHERVLYERTVERFREEKPQSQQLLFPQTVELATGDAALVRELQPHLEGLGFGLKFFGAFTVILDGVPVDVKPGDENAILRNVLDLYKEDERTLKLEPRDRLAKSYSCKAAIKAGDLLSDAEMTALLDQLFQTEVPFVCPHGRPVAVKLSLAELDHRFGRTS